MEKLNMQESSPHFHLKDSSKKNKAKKTVDMPKIKKPVSRPKGVGIKGKAKEKKRKIADSSESNDLDYLRGRFCQQQTW